MASADSKDSKSLSKSVKAERRQVKVEQRKKTADVMNVGRTLRPFYMSPKLRFGKNSNVCVCLYVCYSCFI